MSHIVLAKAWNNGKFLPNGGGCTSLTNYFKDEYLDINWVSITLELEGWEKQVELAINTDAFWSHGRELRSGVIGKWLIANGKASWTAGRSRKSFCVRWAADTSPLLFMQKHPPTAWMPFWQLHSRWMNKIEPNGRPCRPFIP